MARLMWSQRDPSLRKSSVGNVFVKNLDPEIDSKDLYDTFSIFGNIISCKVVSDQQTGKSKGFGFVHFETAESAAEAIAKVNGNVISGRVVYVSNFQKRDNCAKNQEFTNLYVKNIRSQCLRRISRSSRHRSVRLRLVCSPRMTKVSPRVSDILISRNTNPQRSVSRVFTVKSSITGYTGRGKEVEER